MKTEEFKKNTEVNEQSNEKIKVLEDQIVNKTTLEEE